MAGDDSVEETLGDRIWTVATMAIPAFATLGILAALPAIARGEISEWSARWFSADAGESSFDIALAFRLDGLGAVFALLVAGMGVAILSYANRYFRGHVHRRRITAFLVLFACSMLGLVVADDLLTLFVFWELTTVFSYLLIGTDHEKPAARAAALQALVVTGGGGLLMLAGFLVVGHEAGTFRISEICAAGDILRDSSLYPVALLLVFAGALTKSAQFPFSFWLPGAMAAPTPISAYLHSATMVKAGVFLLARLAPALDATPMWTSILVPIGAITMVSSAIAALRFTDLKLICAYTTVTALGAATLFLGIGGSEAATTVIAFVITHSLYKGGLFMVVGIIDKRCGSRDLRDVVGVGSAMPVTAVAALLAGVSMAGLPPTIGFLSKELMYESTLHAGMWGYLSIPALVVANAIMIAVAGIVVIGPLMGREMHSPKEPAEGPFEMAWGPVVLGFAGLFGGLFAYAVGNYLIHPGVSSMVPGHESMELHLWHGFNLPLLLSVVTVACGVFLYKFRDQARATLVAFDSAVPIRCERLYDTFMASVLWVANFQTRRLQTGILRNYLLVTFATFAALTGFTMFFKGAVSLPDSMPKLNYHEWVIVGLVLTATIFAVRSQTRLGMITSLGVVGLGVSTIFFLFGAPDVAMTQLMVETLVVIIVVLVFLKLPKFEGDARSGWGGRWRDLAVACSCGLVVTLLVLSVTSTPVDTKLSDFFLSASKPEAHGSNVVNVILVDFRGVDTMGEVTVLTLAGLAAYALIKLKSMPRRDPS